LWNARRPILLHAIAADGALLITEETIRHRLIAITQAPPASSWDREAGHIDHATTDLSWFEDSTLVDFAGETVTFRDRQSAGAPASLFARPLAGGDAIALPGDGGGALDRTGKRVLVRTRQHTSPPHLAIVSLDDRHVTDLPAADANGPLVKLHAFGWLSADEVVMIAEGHIGLAVYRQRTDGSLATFVQTWMGKPEPEILRAAPDGKRFFAIGTDNSPYLVEMTLPLTLTQLPEHRGKRVTGWSAGGDRFFLAEFTPQGLVVSNRSMQSDVESSASPMPASPGTLGVDEIVMTSEDVFAMSYVEIRSEAFRVGGVR
jgi:hypothetical protein